jgi:hypothetical protein
MAMETWMAAISAVAALIVLHRRMGQHVGAATVKLKARAHSVLHPYRPELHYMRGPGPKWMEKHGGRCE